MNQHLLVLGASGLTGTEVVKLLNQDNAEVRVSYREQSELNVLRNFAVEPIWGDFTDPQSLLRAMKGISCAALILPVHEQMAEFGHTVVDCARKAGLPKLVVLSNMGANPKSNFAIPRQHGEIVSYLEKSGVPHHIVKAAPYFQNLFWSVITIVRHHRLSLPLGNEELPYIDIRDVAAFIAKLLCSDDIEPNKTFIITGPESLSMFAVSRALSEALGYGVRYNPTPAEKGSEVFRAMGLTPWLAGAIADMYTEYASGNYGTPSTDFAEIIGRAPSGLAEFIVRDMDVFAHNDIKHRMSKG